jgi:MHS family proline/betaine transporter-like MFS transporter
MKKTKIITASILGTALEFYDFTLYGIFTPILANMFFPSDDPVFSKMLAFAAFAASFLMRPFGAAIFGHIGDKWGRKKALSLSILMMGIPTFVVGVLPGYETLGIMAPLLIVACRLLQGISAGGEYNGAAIFALEHIRNRPGLVGSLIATSGGLGGIFAMTMGYFSSLPGSPDYAWRLPFILGGVVSLIGIYLRYYIGETPLFEHVISQEKVDKFPLKQVFIKYKKRILGAASIGGLDGALSYILVGFMNVYLESYVGIPLHQAMLLNSIGLGVYLIGTPVMGWLFDLMKPQTFLNSACLMISILIVPIFLLMKTAIWEWMILGEFLFAILLASISGSHHAYLQQMFPTEERYTGIGVSFSLGTALLGGTAPLFLLAFIEIFHNILIPAYFLIGLSGLCLFSTLNARDRGIKKVQ